MPPATLTEAIPTAPVARVTRPRQAWAHVVLASLLMAATLPGRTQGLGLITEPLLLDLGLERTTFAEFNLWATLMGALICFPAGWMIDRFGLRWFTAGITLMLGLIVWQLSAFAGGMTMLFLLLLATRALGQSALSVCSMTTVGRWFPNRVGPAMGVYSALLSFFFAIAFMLVGHSIDKNGWRSAWLQIAMVLLLGVTPLVLFFLREPAASPRHAATRSDLPDGNSFTLGQALRTPAFWLFAGAAASFNLVSSGLGLFNQAVLAERGFDQKTFHLFLAVTTIMALLGQFLCGWLTTRWRFQTLALCGLALYAAGLAGIPLVHAQWQLWIVALFLGMSAGMVIVIFFAVWSEVFGQQHLGRILGAAQILTVLASALGPVLFAKCWEARHSYAPLLFTLALAVLLLGLIGLRVPMPNRSTSSRDIKFRDHGV